MARGTKAAATDDLDSAAHPDEVFISYSRADVGFANEVAAGLEARGLTVWIDREDIPPATDWMTEINEGMASAEGLIVIITPDWAGSDICGVEVDRALSLGKRVVPILRTMADDVHTELASRNWIFWRDDSEAETALDAVEEALRVDPEWTREHTRLLQQALRWEARKKDKNLLLRGDDLATAEASVALVRPTGVPKVTKLQHQFVQASRAAATGRLRRLVVTAIVVAAVSVGLAIVAVISRQEANRQRAEAVRQEEIAVEQRAEAVRQEKIAVEQRDEADRQRAEAERQREEAERQRDTATSTALASQSQNNVEAEPDLAALLALEAFRTKDTVDARGSLLQVLGTPTSFAGREARHEVSISAVAYYEATNLAATADVDGTVVLWDAPADGTTAGVARDQDIVVAGHVTSLAFGPDASSLVIATSEDGVETWDITTSPPSQLGRSAIEMVDSNLSGDGSLAVGFARDEGDEANLVAYDVAGDELSAFVPLGLSVDDLEESEPTAIAISADGTKVAFGVGDQLVVWSDSGELAVFAVQDVIDLEEFDVTSVDELALTLRSVVFVGDTSQIVFAVEEGDLFLIDFVDDDVSVASRAFPSSTSAAAALSSPTDVDDLGFGGLVGSAHDNGEVKLWGASDGSLFELATFLGHDEEALAVGFTADGGLVSGSWDGDVIWWSANPIAQLGVPMLFPGETRSHQVDVAGAEFVREDLVVSLATDGLVYSWDPTTLGLIEAPVEEEVSSIDEAGGLIAFGRFDGSVVAVDTADGSRTEFDAVSNEAVTLVAVSPDRSTIASVQDEGIVLWDASSGEFARFAEIPTDLEVAAISLPSADVLWVGGVVVSADDDPYSVAVRLDTATGELVDAARHNDDEFGHVVTAIALSPDGTTLVTGGSDRRIFVWDTNDLSTATAEWAVHREVVADLVFLDDGVLLSADLERRVLMWDVDSGRAVGELTGPTDGVNALDLQPDGGYLIAGGEDDTLWLWDMRIDSWLEGACNLAGRNLSDQEWARFRFGEQPVRHCEQYGPVDWPLADYPTAAG